MSFGLVEQHTDQRDTMAMHFSNDTAQKSFLVPGSELPALGHIKHRGSILSYVFFLQAWDCLSMVS